MRVHFFVRRVALLLGVGLLASAPARAESRATAPATTAPATAVTPPAASAPAPSVPPVKSDAAPEAAVLGFRSAHFGMDEAEVREAIAKDFGSAVSIKSTTNAAERTHGLVVRAPDVLPGGGAADVAYVFGYKSKKLIQVSLVWSKATDPAMTGEKLVADAEVLRQTFGDQGYKPDTIVSDVATRGGVILFRGSDAEGRTTALILQGHTGAADKDKGQRAFTPLSLLLLYIADPKHADVFRLKPGQF